MMNVKINHNDISSLQILRISQGEKTKDVMSLWDKIKDWFQSNKREKALKIVENIVVEEKFDDKNNFKMLYHVLMLKTMASDAYKERIKINTNDNDKNITISIDNYNISITDIDNEQLNKMSTIINAFNRHSLIFSNEIALKCLYEKLDKNELNDQIFAELYIELDNKIRSGEIDLKLNKSNFNQVNFSAIRQLVSKAIENDNTNLDTENDNANLENDNINLENDNANLENDNANLENDNANLENDNANLENDNANLENDNANLNIKKALIKDINRNTYIFNGKEIKSKDQDEAMEEFETLTKDISEKNKKAIYYLLNQEGITLIKSYNDSFDYYTLTTSFSMSNVVKQEQIYSIKTLSDDLIELKIKFFKKSSDKINLDIPLAQPFESKLYNFIYDMVAINNNIEITYDKILNEKMNEIIKQLNNKKPRLGELFSHLLSRNKIIKEDSVDITLKLNKGQLVSLGGECSYNFY
ncbi:TPA: hypothetical protein SMM89_001578 [Proteus mirabilis]|uniref:CTLH domain-containing protein n=5 Tax=Proteus mirabilis TaxID=584 RepID=A0A7D5WA57_PROMI|nr:hypothetical protein [Proteus mirabilis]EKV3641232.1 hypothetical protein [Proteus mirabilis]ELA6757180.1 hypothetical protein [Proteus mirabilis]ELA7749729.1 hypothetical protein [Proteus mirabilis]ELA7952927.1 hypothetical protein [Proteus mirabilis]ELB2031438.1 hypothetical protein [Proteus mirabilis]